MVEPKKSSDRREFKAGRSPSRWRGGWVNEETGRAAKAPNKRLSQHAPPLATGPGGESTANTIPPLAFDGF
jgi:hypothetical protein